MVTRIGSEAALNARTHAEAKALLQSYHQSILGVANPAVLPSAPFFPPVQLSNDVPQKSKVSTTHGLHLSPASTAPSAAGGIRSSQDWGFTSLDDVAESFGQLGDYGPAIIRSDARLVYPSDGASYKGAMGEDMSGVPLDGGDEGGDSERARLNLAGVRGDFYDLDALMQRNRDKLGRLRRSMAEASGRAEAQALVGKFVSEEGGASKLTFSDQSLRGFASSTT